MPPTSAMQNVGGNAYSRHTLIKKTDKLNEKNEQTFYIYKDAGEPETALTYFRLAAQNAKTVNQPVRYNRIMGDISMLLDQLDSAIYYYKEAQNCIIRKTTDGIIRKRNFSYQSVNIGEVYLKQHKYNLAIEQFKLPLQFFENGNDKTGVMRVLSALARCYQTQQNFSASF